MKNCIFCDVEESRIILSAWEYWNVIYDIYPVNKGHMLIIPKRHVESYFDLEIEEVRELDYVLQDAKYILDKEFKPDGYNIGMNLGVAAGQTVNHHHIHLIPRFNGDIPDPRGGVRGVIPEKRIY